jgi:hypothetical protein
MKRCILVSFALLGLACQPPAVPEAGPPPTAPPPPLESAEPEPTAGAGGAEAPTAEPSAPEPPPAPAEPPEVKVSEPKFIGDGTVPKVEAFLDKMKEAAAKCVADNGPVTTGSIRIQFLVRLSGRAEGVDVQSATGVSEAAQHCVRDAFKHKQVGTPTADPTGVQFTYTFE